ncbi:MAG: imidazole glycerol phosphate synthase cyclase subunit [Candidatus Margulisbacteria bacterium]|nr:imidazole glycerol phosphate synthase cyclase subunit [Candidatus Margulisiibacteriota bacterium]MBU1628195.1 imidazole glycerol phosphate synthase cyclase subunit [bacterium]
MLTKRIIPLFLLKGSRLVKGSHFGDYVDVGDPVSQAMIYDAQGAEEVVILDIEATKHDRMIDTSIITEAIEKCRLPIAAGGGIKNLEDAHCCFRAGADKIVINSHAALNPDLVKEMSDEFGSQSVVASIDVNKSAGGRYDVYIFSGTKKIDIGLEKLVETYLANGIGEIIVTSIGQEGTLSGFDCDLYQKLRPLVNVPLIASGGSGSYDDMVNLFQKSDCDGVALGKMLCLRDYDIVRIKSYLKGKNVLIRET